MRIHAIRVEPYIGDGQCGMREATGERCATPPTKRVILTYDDGDWPNGLACDPHAVIVADTAQEEIDAGKQVFEHSRERL